MNRSRLLLQRVRFEDRGSHRGLYAQRAFERGERLLKVDGEETETPTMHSLQLSRSHHIVAPTEDVLPPNEDVSNHGWRFLVHACEPNATFHVASREIRAVRSIEQDEEISLDYNESEARLACPFECECGSQQCVGTVRGYKVRPEKNV